MPASRQRLAPLTTTMLFSPRRSTTMNAVPVGSSAAVHDAARVDALVDQVGEGEASRIVVADGPEEDHRCSVASRGHGLVGALAAAGASEGAAKDRLTRSWHLLDLDDQVEVAGAHHEDPAGGRHINSPASTR